MATGKINSSSATQCAAASPIFSDTSFIHTDISRVRSDWFSSAASRLIASPFNTIFFIITGGRSRRAFARMTPDSVRARARAYRPPFFRHLRMIFHNSMLYSLNGNGYSPVSSVLSSHCKHGLSVRMVEFLSCFSGGVYTSCVSTFFSKLRLVHGGRSSRAFARMIPDSVRARARAYRSPFFRHLSMIFHNIRTTLRSERGNNRPSLSALSSHCKHGFSVRIIQSLLTFSRDVRPAAVIGNRDARPSFARLYEQFFITY